MFVEVENEKCLKKNKRKIAWVIGVVSIIAQLFVPLYFYMKRKKE